MWYNRKKVRPPQTVKKEDPTTGETVTMHRSGTNQNIAMPGKPGRISRNFGIKNKLTRYTINMKRSQSFHEDSSIDKTNKKISLLDFNRKTHEEYYNRYMEDKYGSPKAVRILIKGLEFFDQSNNKVAEVEVERRNQYSIITKFYIDKKYQGMGFAKELLTAAKFSLNANAVEADIREMSKIRFFERHDFVKKCMEKQICILTLDDKNNSVTKPTDVANIEMKTIKHPELEYENDVLYNTGGFGYDGYGDYI